MNLHHGNHLLAICLVGAFALWNCAGAAAQDSPVFDIPRLDKAVIDGNAADWGDAGFRIDALAPVDGKVKSPDAFDARCRLAWNDAGLLVLVTYRNPAPSEWPDVKELWRGDCVELYLADHRGGKEIVQAVVAPGIDPNQPQLRSFVYDMRKDEAMKKTAPTLTAARTRIDGGCVMEILLPWANVGVVPKPGLEVAFQVFADNIDGQSQYHAVWYPATPSFNDSNHMHTLRLSDKAGPPVLAAGRGGFDGWKRTQAVVIGTPQTAGKSVALLADGKEIAHGTLAESAGRAVAKLKAPLPSPAQKWNKLDILMDGKTIDTLYLPDLAKARADATARLKFVFRPFCFAGATLPDGDLENPLEAENIIGPYTTKITYYDANLNVVASALKPGRYGADVEIQPEGGAVIRRAYTLYRMAGDIRWRDVKIPAKIDFPKEFGLDPAIVAEQAEEMGSYVKDLLREDINRSPDSAIVLSWLRETAPGTPVVDRCGPGAVNDKYLHELRRKSGHLRPIQYNVWLPPGAAADPAKKWPTILFLHGSGGGGDGNANEARLMGTPVMAYAKKVKDFPFIVVAAWCPAGQWWRAPELDDLYADMLAKYPIDLDRVYLTGLSMGGYGSWAWAPVHPDRFAAVVPICGAGDPRDVDQIKDVPIWVFHGAKDPTVPVKCSYDMVEALRKVHARVRFTVFPEAGHDSWTATYNTPALYEWLLQQVRGKPQQPPATMTGTAPSDPPANVKP